MNTLLVVEDEKLIRQGIVAMIRRRGIGDFEKTEGGRHVH